MAPAAVAASGLTKSFGENAGLFDVDLSMAPGTVMALLGPNGAGKTTAMRVLSTLLKPDRGDVYVGGFNVLRQPREVQSVIGLAGQSASIDGKLSGADNLAMFGRLHRLSWRTVRDRRTRLLEQFGLAEVAKRAVQSYSGGMRRKLDLAVSLIGEPSILFLDEPTAGLDPASRQTLWGILKALVAQGTSVLLTTQYLDEADALADAITFIDAGRVVAQGSPGELKRRVGQTQLDVSLATSAEVAALTRALAGFTLVSDDDRRTIRIALPPGDSGISTLKAVVDALDHSGIPLRHYTIREPSLDDVYFQLTGRARTERYGADDRRETTT